MRIILYRYHNNLKMCIDRLSFIKKYNPDIPIYGLFGGEEEIYSKYDEALKPFFTGNYCIKDKTSFWKWKNSDLAYRLWYSDYGKNISFDSLVVLEWDLILFGSIDEIYNHVSHEQVGLTGLVELSTIEKEWFWIRDPKQGSFWTELLEYVKEKHGYNKDPYGALCPGVCLPRTFLEAFSKIDVPELCHDELRLPLFAQALGFELIDNGFYKKWFSKKESKYFNCNELNISTKRIKKELAKKEGRRVFHPFREVIKTEPFN